MGKFPACRVLIYGSCVSRDIFSRSFLGGVEYVVSDYFARSSLASLSRPFVDHDLHGVLESIKSDFQRRMVERDIKKSFFLELRENNFDIILMDLIDERFNIWEGIAGDTYTLSSELVQTGFLREGRPGFVIKTGSDEFWSRWEAGWCKLVHDLELSGNSHRLVVNKVYWSQCTESGAPFDGIYSASMISEANILLDRMYSRMAHDIDASQFLGYEDNVLLGSDSHKWGRSPFHYVEGFYSAAAQKLTKLYLKKTKTFGGSVVCDVAKWNLPVFVHKELGEIDPSSWVDGIHRVAVVGDHYIDLLAQGLDKISKNEGDNVLLVGLSGAISGRNGKKAPFFSGANIARDLGMPIIAISDPTLAMDPDLPLSWYAGNECVPDLQALIADLINRFADKLNSRPLIFGGSGGGFAALQLGTKISCEASILVWNPQTSISEYAPIFVKKYVDAAFTSISGRLHEELEVTSRQDINLLRAGLDEMGVCHDVTDCNVGVNVRVFYLQNQSDWHCERHARPYMRNKKWDAIDGDSYLIAPQRNIAVVFGNWGEGHIAPPREIILDSIRRICIDNDTESFVRFINGRLSLTSKSENSSEKAGGDFLLNIEAQAAFKDGRVIVKAYAEFPGEVIKFAFYLLKNGDKFAIRWYEHSSENIFMISPKEGETLEVVAFVRTAAGIQASVRVPVNID